MCTPRGARVVRGVKVVIVRNQPHSGVPDPQDGTSPAELCDPGPVGVSRYLDELGLPAHEGAQPSAPRLETLHSHHARRFAHDTLWIARRRIPEVTSLGLVGALLAGEGGVCTQLGIGFAWLLNELGYDVRLHRARVQFAFDDDYREWPLHPVMTVVVGGRTWYADVGMGNGLLLPVPLAEGALAQPGGFTFALERSPHSPWDRQRGSSTSWEFRTDPRLRGVRKLGFDTEEIVSAESFAETYFSMVNEQSSPFRRTVGASIRSESGILTLNQDVVTRQDGGGRTRRRLEDATEYVSVLREQFRLKLPDLRIDELHSLWRRVSTT